MRRRPIILCILAAAALGGATIALADSPPTTTPVKALGESPDAQLGPVLAANPVAGANAPVVALGTDWRSGLFEPQTVDASGTVQGTSGTTVWSDHGLMPSTSSPPMVSGGSPDVVWGPGNKVYAVELGRDSGDPQNPCASNAGLYLSVSSNAGASWAAPVSLVNDSPSISISDPSIAYSSVTGRIYVAYTVSEPCSGGLSEIRMTSMTDTSGNGLFPIDISPSAPSPLFVHPSIATLPNGDVAIAYYDAAQNTGGRVLVTTCSPSDPTNLSSVPTCDPSVDPSDVTSTVDPSAGAPKSIGELAVDVRPSIAADRFGRVVVAWDKAVGLSGSGIDVYSATSQSEGTFGPPVPVSPDPGLQFDPQVGIAADGRADIAFFESRFSPLGYKVAVAASNPPIPGSPFETWSTSEQLEPTVITPVSPYVPGPPDIGSRIGLAEIERTSGRAWTLVAWTDTSNVSGSAPQNEDIYSSVLLHQSTTPVGTPLASPYPVSKNAPNQVPFGASDADADPLTYSIISSGGIGTATIANKNVPMVTYVATKAVGPDTVVVGLDDGVNHSTLTLNLLVQNDPPTVSCPKTPETPFNTALLIAATGCGQDKNGDFTTLSATSPVHGTLTGSGPNQEFVPADNFSGTAQVIMTASDGELSSQPTLVNITVDPETAVAVSIEPSGVRAARTDRAIEFRATPTDARVVTDLSKITWDFGDGTVDHGPTVSHLFTQVNTYTVLATIGNGPPATVTVIVQKPPLIVRDTSLLHKRTVKLKLQIANPGKLTVKLVGVPGSRELTAKMKRGTHTVHMLLPAAARRSGTIVVSLALGLPNGGTERIRRAIMLPRG
jgi:PKD domain/Bacterial Ig domain